jgi:hypothetical protein
MSGFGLVHPLPGIADGLTLNSAITLPVGVEAYSAYALGTWLSDRPIPARARRFAAHSSLIALGLGLLGQVVYHLLSAAGYSQAPMWVVVFVSCLPVLVLGAGASLHHLLGTEHDEDNVATRSAGQDVSSPEPGQAAPPRARAKRAPKPRRLLTDYLAEARGQLAAGVEPTPAWCRRVTGCSAGTSVKLAAALRAERTADTPHPGAMPTTDQREDAA